MAKATSETDIAIIGMSALFAQASGLESYWRLICEGRDGIGPVPESHWRLEDYYSADPKSRDHTYGRTGGFLEPFDFDPLKYGIPPHALEATDTSQLLAMAMTHEALCDAGYDPGGDWERQRASCILGVTGALELVVPLGARLGHPQWRRALQRAGVSDAVAAQVMEDIQAQYVGWQEASFPGLLGNVVAGRVANHFDLGGTNNVLDAACASSLAAVRVAVQELISHQADLVVTGGVDTFNDIFMYMCFSKTPALSPTGHARSFDNGGDGTVLGEGVGVVILKRLSDARRDGDRVYAVIKAVGSSSDGKGTAIYAPKSSGQARALQRAYDQAGIDPATVGLIEGHGTGTAVGDGVEIEGLKAVFPATAEPGCALGSVKSQIGHAKAAAGVAGLIKAALALDQRVLPPTIKVEAPHKGLAGSWFYLNHQAQPWLPKATPRRAGVSAFGFGGSNFHAVLEEAPPELRRRELWLSGMELCFLAAEDRTQLEADLEGLEQLTWSGFCQRAYQSRKSLGTDAAWRLALVVAAEADLAAAVQDAQKLLKTGQSGRFGRAVLETGASAGRLAVMFSGQGSQYVNMLKDVSLHAPVMLDALEDLSELQQAAYLYPLSGGEQEAKGLLQQTQNAQPLLGAVCAGLWQLLSGFGMRADGFCGHSFGELTALYAAGAWQRQWFLAAAAQRGALMAALPGDHGGMLAVMAPAETVVEFCREQGLALSLANENGPRQSVVAGSRAACAAGLEALQAAGFMVKALPVSAAFHSALVEPVTPLFAEFLAELPWQPLQAEVFANSDGQLYPQDQALAAQKLAAQISQPVRFSEQLQAMYRAGYRRFVEIGPKSVLKGLAQSILGQEDVKVVALDEGESSLQGFAMLVAQLGLWGQLSQLEKWPGDQRARRCYEQRKPYSISICGANKRPAALPKQPEAPQQERRLSNTRAAQQPLQPVVQAKNFTGDTQVSQTHDTSNPQPAPSRALEMFQESLLALQQLQLQSARLHEQYLKGHEQAQMIFADLMTKQQAYIQGQPMVFTRSEPASQPKTPVMQSPASVPVTPDFARSAPVPVPVPVAQPVAHVTAPEPVLAASLTQVQPVPSSAQPLESDSSAVDVISSLKEVVAEKTGYPAEMLEMTMHLESDLGIDSIKRVEILAALKEQWPELDKYEPEQVNSAQTLAEIAAFLTEGPATSVQPAAEPLPASAPDGDYLDTLKQIVADKTGYPAEMLESQMDLEADLGIDSIKRVEIMAAIAERYPEQGAHLQQHSPQDLKTLDDLVQLLAVGSATEVASPLSTPPDLEPDAAKKKIYSIIADKTGYPSQSLNDHMHLEADLGIDSMKRVEILGAASEHWVIGSDLDQELLNRAQSIADLYAALMCLPLKSAMQSDQDFEPDLERLLLQAVPLNRPARSRELSFAPGALFWLVDDGSDLGRYFKRALEAAGFKVHKINGLGQEPLQPPEQLAGLMMLAPQRDDLMEQRRFLTRAFQVLQLCGPALQEHEAESRLLVAVTRLGGLFATQGLGSVSNCISSGISGLVKAAAHEWPQVDAKVIDLASHFLSPEMAAQRLLEECLQQGPLEVGISEQGLMVPKLVAQALEQEPQVKSSWSADDVVVITGGGRGVTREVSLALGALKPAPRLVILGRSPLPEPEPDWLRGLSDEKAMKRAIITYGQVKHPRAVEMEYQAICRSRALRDTCIQLDALGCSWYYHAVDVKDKNRLQKLVAELREQYGPITGLVHGAGVLHDKLILEKTVEQFDDVVATKLESLIFLLEALEPSELKALVLFSSSTARYGRRGQSDYAAANEALNKLAQYYRSKWPQSRAMALNWGPWDGGMVDEALKQIFRAENIGVIPLKRGGQQVIRELAQMPGRLAEVVLFAAPEPSLDPNLELSDKAALQTPALLWQQQVDMKAVPVLADHVLDGQAVIPVALMVEWLAQAVAHQWPDEVLRCVRQFQVLRGVRLAADQGLTLEFWVERQVEGRACFDMSIYVQGAQPHLPCYRATVELGSRQQRPSDGEGFIEPLFNAGLAWDHEAYAQSLFHGRKLQGIVSVDGLSQQGISCRCDGEDAPSEWLAEAGSECWLSYPKLLDQGFQALVLWSRHHWQLPNLPMRFSSLEFYDVEQNQAAGDYQVVVQVVKAQQPKLYSHLEIRTAGGQVLVRLRGYEAYCDAGLEEAYGRNKLEAAGGEVEPHEGVVQ